MYSNQIGHGGQFGEGLCGGGNWGGKSWRVRDDLKKLYGCEPEEALDIEDFHHHGQVDTNDIMMPRLYVGCDNRVYRDAHGLINARVPVASTEDPNIYVDSINWDMFPPESQFGHLFDEFFDEYDREVLMIMGKNRDGSGWTYVVPDQEGTSAHVKWDDEDASTALSQNARWVGTIHVHPGNCCFASGVDIREWEKPECSGLHLILGRGGDYKIYGALAGCVWLLKEGNHLDAERESVDYITSNNKPLEELLRIPVRRTITTKRTVAVTKNKMTTEAVVARSDSDTFFSEFEIAASGRSLSINDQDQLMIVYDNESTFVITEYEYNKIKLELGDGCPEASYI